MTIENDFLVVSIHDFKTNLSKYIRQLQRGDVRGVVVRSVEAGGAAELAGLARGDVIVMVSGEEISSVREFNSAIRKAGAAKAARLRVRRGDSVLVVALRLDR